MAVKLSLFCLPARQIVIVALIVALQANRIRIILFNEIEKDY